MAWTLQRSAGHTAEIILVGRVWPGLNVSAAHAQEHGPLSACPGALSWRVAMSASDQFRRYAEEALAIAEAKTEEEKQTLLGLLCTWAEAAVSV
jgi:hypothetical protein